jgi:hypothetical protein
MYRDVQLITQKSRGVAFSRSSAELTRLLRLMACTAGIKWTRNWSGKMLELLLLVLAAVVCGQSRLPASSACPSVPQAV